VTGKGIDALKYDLAKRVREIRESEPKQPVDDSGQMVG
jgi:hypothetical protein